VPVHGGLLRLDTPGNGHIVDITAGVESVVRTAEVQRGLVCAFATGSTVAVTTMEYEPGGVHDLPGLGFLLVGLPELGAELEGPLDRVLPAEHRGRVHLAQAVADGGGEVQHAGGVADALLPLDRLERDDLRDVVAAVLGGRVPDDLVPPALVGPVVLVDLTGELLEVAGKFVTYALFPASAYSVLVTRSKSKCKISIGYNPWSNLPRRHNIAEICERHGGGGHPNKDNLQVGTGLSMGARDFSNFHGKQIIIARGEGFTGKP